MANLNVTYGDMRHAGTQLTGFENQIQDTLKQAQALITNLVASGFVTDAASKAFDDAYSHFTQGATQMIGGMTDMCNYLNKAADQMEATDTALAQQLHKG